MASNALGTVPAGSSGNAHEDLRVYPRALTALVPDGNAVALLLIFFNI